MADINLNTILKVRRGTTEEWGENAYTLLEGEFGFDTELKVLKIGDGSSNWSELTPVNAADLSAFLKGVKVGDKTFTVSDNKVASITKQELLTALDLTPEEYLTADDLSNYLQASDIDEGGDNGTISVKGNDVKVKGLGTAAYKNVGDFDAAGAASAVDTKVTTLTGRVGENENNITSLQGTVGTLNTDVSGLKTDVGELKNTVKGLTGAMHFVGTSTVDPTTDGPTIVGHEGGYEKGDVCLYGNKEYVYDGESWVEFGDNGDLVTNSQLDAYLKNEDAEKTYAKATALTEEATTARAAEKAAKDAADAAQKDATQALANATTAQQAAEDAQSEAESASAAATAAQNTANAAMPKTGGAFTGEVTLAANPTKDLGAATKKYVDTAIAGVPAATVTNIKQGNEIVVTKSGTEYTIAHAGITTASIPTADKTAKTAYFTGMTVQNGHVTEVTATKLEDGLNALTNTFILDGGKADGSWE